MPPDAWVAFLNREAEALAALQPPLPKGALRGHLRDRLAEAFAFPLDLEVRALVAGDRHDALPTDGGPIVAAGARHLEVVPEGLTRDAAGLIGPLLLRTDRPLQPGSVLRLKLRVEDPRLETPDVPGVRAQVLEMIVEVAVEP